MIQPLSFAKSLTAMRRSWGIVSAAGQAQRQRGGRHGCVRGGRVARRDGEPWETRERSGNRRPGLAQMGAHWRRGEVGRESAGLRASTRVFWHGIDVEAAVTVALAGLVALGLVWV